MTDAETLVWETKTRPRLQHRLEQEARITNRGKKTSSLRRTLSLHRYKGAKRGVQRGQVRACLEAGSAKFSYKASIGHRHDHIVMRNNNRLLSR